MAVSYCVTALLHRGSLEAGHRAGSLEDRVEHRRGDPAGEGVLLARVVAAKQQDLAARAGRSP